MKIALINPNSTASMTQKALVSARMVVSEGTTVIASNPSDTPKSIEGHYDEAISVPGLLVEVEYAQQAGSSQGPPFLLQPASPTSIRPRFPCFSTNACIV